MTKTILNVKNLSISYGQVKAVDGGVCCIAETDEEVVIMTDNDLIANLDKLHTTELGAERIRKNLSLDTDDPARWCKQKIVSATDIIRKGKNWYASVDGCVFTVNAGSFSIITAHKEKAE